MVKIPLFKVYWILFGLQQISQSHISVFVILVSSKKISKVSKQKKQTIDVFI